jgi:hypothetical protein
VLEPLKLGTPHPGGAIAQNRMDRRIHRLGEYQGLSGAEAGKRAQPDKRDRMPNRLLGHRMTRLLERQLGLEYVDGIRQTGLKQVVDIRPGYFEPPELGLGPG